VSASWPPHKDDQITLRDSLNARSDLLHNPGAFMPKDHRERTLEIPHHVVKVAVADASSQDTHEHLARAGIGESNFL